MPGAAAGRVSPVVEKRGENSRLGRRARTVGALIGAIQGIHPWFAELQMGGEGGEVAGAAISRHAKGDPVKGGRIASLAKLASKCSDERTTRYRAIPREHAEATSRLARKTTGERVGAWRPIQHQSKVEEFAVGRRRIARFSDEAVTGLTRHDSDGC